MIEICELWADRWWDSVDYDTMTNTKYHLIMMTVWESGTRKMLRALFLCFSVEIHANNNRYYQLKDFITVLYVSVSWPGYVYICLFFGRISLPIPRAIDYQT